MKYLFCYGGFVLFIVLIFVQFLFPYLFFAADRRFCVRPVFVLCPSSLYYIPVLFLLLCQLGQVVVVFSFFEKFCPEAVFGSVEAEGLEVDV